MGAEILTTEDLREFKLDLIDEIKKLIKNQSNHGPGKWLKSNDVRKILSISPGTLQNMRITGVLPYSKVGGVIFYDYDDIVNLMQSKKVINAI